MPDFDDSARLDTSQIEGPPRATGGAHARPADPDGRHDRGGHPGLAGTRMSKRGARQSRPLS
jgi:hypothetical protein